MPAICNVRGIHAIAQRTEWGGNGEEMGRNEVSAFVCKASGWGHMGRNGVSPLEMGTEGRGRVSGIPIPKGGSR
jgi:hypothetical protein